MVTLGCLKGKSKTQGRSCGGDGRYGWMDLRTTWWTFGLSTFRPRRCGERKSLNMIWIHRRNKANCPSFFNTKRCGLPTVGDAGSSSFKWPLPWLKVSCIDWFYWLSVCLKETRSPFCVGASPPATFSFLFFFSIIWLKGHRVCLPRKLRGANAKATLHSPKGW